jgi:molecular chaperone GrpE
MSDAATPDTVEGFSGDATDPNLLSPESIDRTLADFRTWLMDLTSLPQPEPVERAPFDLNALIGQFTALRHEVNLHTKASRTNLEQNSQTLAKLEQVLEAHDQTSDEPSIDKEMLKGLLDIHDSLTLALKQISKHRDTFKGEAEEAHLELPPLPAIAEVQPVIERGFWKRRPSPDPTVKSNRHLLQEWLQQVQERFLQQRQHALEARDRYRQALEGLIAGYQMSLNRIERLLPKYNLDAIESVGTAFNPELMEVVEVVLDSTHPSGNVIEEVRRGYFLEGSVFRYAQVKVAR